MGAEVIYIWKICDDYPDSLIGEYDRERGPDRFSYKQGKKLDAIPASAPRFRFNASINALSAMNVLANNAMVPLVSSRVAAILSESCPNEAQLIPAEVVCKDGVIDGYSIVVVTNRVRGLDHAKSKYKCMPGEKAIMRFESAVYKEDCLGSLSLARDGEYLSNLLVSERLLEALKSIEDLGIYSSDNVDWS
jgi:hypothetical protein